jgi:hypothetical protein
MRSLSILHNCRIRLPRVSLTIPQRRRIQTGDVVVPSAGGANDYHFGPANEVQPQPATQQFVPKKDEAKSTRESPEKPNNGGGPGDSKNGGRGSDNAGDRKAGTAWKMFESAATTAASLTVLGYA